MIKKNKENYHDQCIARAKVENATMIEISSTVLGKHPKLKIARNFPNHP